MNIEKFIKIEEAAKMLNVVKMTLWRWDIEEKLRVYRHQIDNWYLCKKSDIGQLL